MRPWQITLAIAGLAALLTIGSVALHASPFVVFPKATELVSPDARFTVRSVDAAGARPISSAPSTLCGSSNWPPDVRGNSATIWAWPPLHGRAMTTSS
jgi:hypothetical protein